MFWLIEVLIVKILVISWFVDEVDMDDGLLVKIVSVVCLMCLIVMVSYYEDRYVVLG